MADKFRHGNIHSSIPAVAEAQRITDEELLEFIRKQGSWMPGASTPVAWWAAFDRLKMLEKIVFDAGTRGYVVVKG